ncbi:MAG TPA: 3-hydroxyacyl-CoA dehydrogenase NAD-binding domain-containing protein [Pseudolabrys sp.]|nr:3-hydroxyacyl-CoA dehydrogenase NAD-binding domain-containing protein [Pseudolabrys sp.]
MTQNVWNTLEARNLELGPFSGPEGAKAASPWRHWKLATGDDRVAWLIIDKQDASANTLSEDVIVEFDEVLAHIEREAPKGLVIRSGKLGGFIAGADIGEFRGTVKPGDVETRLGRAHAIIDRLDHLNLPTVAVIHGYCLGGGLEVALACDYRIAVEDASLGFPEVLLGLHPGLGGTVRLPRLINPLQAMTNMLTGKSIRARKAKALGLVDAVTQERHVLGAVTAAVTGQMKTARADLSVTLLNSLPARRLLAWRMRGETEKKAPAKQYPAPHALIDLWARYGGNPPAMQKAEVTSFAHLLTTPAAQNLIRVFFLRDKLKGMASGEFPGHRIHVIGAGAMGGDIAAWCAWHGFTVTLADMKAEPLAGAIKRAADLFKKIAHKSTDIRDALDRLTPDLKGDGVGTADLIIEAVPEKLDLKKKVYAGVEAKMRDDAILATNTSSIPLEDLRKGLKRPERFLGLHFFNPVSRMQLVEVVSHNRVAEDVVAMAQAFLGRIDRLPAPVKSAPGFLVNRALTPYLMEAFVMLDEGIKRETIDRAAEDFGMPMGPIELADQVGLDICVHVAEVLRADLDRPMPPTPKWLSDKVEKGGLGRKTGKGMYVWKNGKAVKDSGAAKPGPDIADRLILPMLDVCVTCLREKVVADEDIIDGAMIFATGFAPFRGGPMHYARSRGTAEIARRLAELAKRYGERFRPDPGWDKLK